MIVVLDSRKRRYELDRKRSVGRASEKLFRAASPSVPWAPAKGSSQGFWDYSSGHIESGGFWVARWLAGRLQDELGISVLKGIGKHVGELRGARAARASQSAFQATEKSF